MAAVVERPKDEAPSEEAGQIAEPDTTPAPPPPSSSRSKHDPTMRILLLAALTGGMVAVTVASEGVRSNVVRFALLSVALLLYGFGVSILLYKFGAAPARWLHEFRRRTHPLPGQDVLVSGIESGDQWRRAAFIAELRALIGEEMALSKRWSPGDLDKALAGASEELNVRPWTRAFLVNTRDVGQATTAYGLYGPEGLLDLVENTVRESRAK